MGEEKVLIHHRHPIKYFLLPQTIIFQHYIIVACQHLDVRTPLTI